MALSNSSADYPMTLPQIINRLDLAQAHPQPEFLQTIPFPKEYEGLWQSSTAKSPDVSEHQRIEAEFHHFSRLPIKLRGRIWWLALPTQRPFEINTQINNKRDNNCVWAVGPFAMLKVCKQSRQVALSIYEPRLQLYTSHEKAGQVLCARPETIPIPRSDGQAFIYMRTDHLPVNIQPDSEVLSVVAWQDIPMGLMRIEVPSAEWFRIKYFWNWPPEEAENPMIATFRKGRWEKKYLPPRLRELELLFPRQDRRRRRN